MFSDFYTVDQLALHGGRRVRIYDFVAVDKKPGAEVFYEDEESKCFTVKLTELSLLPQMAVA